MKVLKGKNLEEIDRVSFQQSVIGFAHTVMDIGTGEGDFIYARARENPETLYIGLDSCADAMVGVSVKVSKKAAKGGLNNAFFVVENAMSLSDDLASTTDEIFIHLPWGSLRDGIIKGDPRLLDSLVRVSKHNASLDIYITYSSRYEESEMLSRGLPELSMSYLRGPLKESFRQAGIQVTEISVMNNEALKGVHTKWAKKLAYGKARDFFHLHCRIQKQNSLYIAASSKASRNSAAEAI